MDRYRQVGSDSNVLRLVGAGKPKPEAPALEAKLIKSKAGDWCRKLCSCGKGLGVPSHSGHALVDTKH